MSSEHYGDTGNSVRDEIAGVDTSNLFHVIDRDKWAVFSLVRDMVLTRSRCIKT